MTDEELDTLDEEDYPEESLEEDVDSDAKSDLEGGFMQGYTSEADPAKCANCNTILEDEDFYEKRIHGYNFRFCSEECRDKFKIK
jgi:hypothetical protein